MNKIKILLFFCLILYSIALLTIEFLTSQDFVRNFFTDIEGPVPFYAINTSLSSLLFILTGILFFISHQLIDKTSKNKKELWFYVTQILIFLYLGLDDRFMFHEKMNYYIGIDGDIVLGLLVLIESFVLVYLGNIPERNVNTKISLLLAGIFTFLMLLFDHLIPQKMVLRLSIEDLAKTWSCFFLLIFSWNILSNNIKQIKEIRSEKVT